MNFKKTIMYLAVFTLGMVLIAILNIWQVLYPEKIIINDQPSFYGLDAVDVTLTTEDGLDISAWFINTNPEQAVILLHGYPAEKSDLLFTAADLASDFSVLLLDFRYFGQSQGDKSTLGQDEILDVRAAVEYLAGQGFEKIGVYGFSLGGAVAILAANTDKRIDAVVSHSSFADLTMLAQDLYRPLFILQQPLVWLMTNTAKILYGVDPQKISPMRAVTTLQIPVMLIHSTEDEQIPFHHAEILAEGLKHNPQAEFVFFGDARHGQSPDDLDTQIKTFLLESLN